MLGQNGIHIVGTLVLVPVGQSGVDEDKMRLEEAILHILGNGLGVEAVIIEVKTALLLLPLHGIHMEIVGKLFAPGQMEPTGDKWALTGQMFSCFILISCQIIM